MNDPLPEGHMASHIGRRKFLATLGGAAAAWPLAARAQQPAIPVIGYLNSGSPESDASRLTGLRRGLNETGYGGNLTGFNGFSGEHEAKTLALLHELVPSTAAIGFLENPNNPILQAYHEREVLTAATVIGLKIQILKAGTDREIDAAF